jgi:hypothetical protein
MGAIANILAETARAFARETLSWSGFDNVFRLRATVARQSFDPAADTVVFGVATLALIPPVQATRRPLNRTSRSKRASCCSAGAARG